MTVRNARLCNRIRCVAERSRHFYGAQAPGHFLIHVMLPSAAPPLPDIRNFDLDRQLNDYLDAMLESARMQWRAREGLEDDSIPCICPRFGMAEHSAWLGLKVRLQENTSLSEPCIHGPDGLKSIRPSETTKWFGYMKKAYAYLRAQNDGTYLLSVRGISMPMELANAVRGNELFVDFMENPVFVHRLLERLTGAILWYYPKLCSWADTVEGGNVFFGAYGWAGPNCLGHASNDTAMLCSPEIYRDFGYPYESLIAEWFGCVIYHVHNEKMHHIPQIACLPNLKLLAITRDPKTPKTSDDLDRILSLSGSVNLGLHVDSQDLRLHINDFKSRNILLKVYCRDREDARDIIALVRDHSKLNHKDRTEFSVRPLSRTS